MIYLYEQPQVSISKEMKDDLVNINNIKIKLIQASFFSYENLSTLANFIDPQYLSIENFDLGADKVIKFKSTTMNTAVYRAIDASMLRWFASYQSILMTILTKEELEFLLSHYFMIYQKEVFSLFNLISIRI